MAESITTDPAADVVDASTSPVPARSSTPTHEADRRPWVRFVLGPVWWTVAIAAVFVGIFVATVPSGFGLDELAHTNRAWQVSRGDPELQTITKDLWYGGPVPRALEDYVGAGTDAANDAVRSPRSFWLRADLPDRSAIDRAGSVTIQNGSDTETVSFSNAGASTFVPYLPAAIGLRIGQLTGADVGTTVLLGKITGGAVYVAMVGLAVFAVRRTRWVWLVATVGLLPVSVFQAATITADTFSNGICLLFTAGILALRARRSPSVGLLVGTGLAGLGVLAAKPTYALLFALVALVPADALPLGRFRHTRSPWILAWGIRSAYVVVGAVLALFFLSRTSGIAQAIKTQVPGWDAIDQGAQQSLLLHHPIGAIGMLGRTVTEFGESWYLSLTSYLGTNGAAIVQPFSTLVFVTLLLAALVAPRLRVLPALLMLLVALVSFTAIVVTLYLTFNPVGAPSAAGVQARYFVPLLIPLCVGTVSLLPLRVRISDRGANVMFGVLLLMPLVVAAAVWQLTLH